MNTRAVIAGLAVLTAIFNANSWVPHSEQREQPAVEVREFVVGGYPPLARQARVEGDVTAILHLNDDGTVASVSNITGPSLLVGAARTLKQWRFQVVKKETRTVRITLRFSLLGPQNKESALSITGKLPNIIEITTNPTSEMPGPNVKRR